ncbi:putative transcriptional regulator [Trichinella spiralis]|uniref:putative transcriptional regulator n=1 Tax=Trichinella spiralis TaxID=6334 RepID=UPI0001EFDB09|nr:putative transcriptional regulator [Trichinella spiralis]
MVWSRLTQNMTAWHGIFQFARWSLFSLPPAVIYKRHSCNETGYEKSAYILLLYTTGWSVDQHIVEKAKSSLLSLTPNVKLMRSTDVRHRKQHIVQRSPV